MPKERIIDTRRTTEPGTEAALTVRWTKDGKQEPDWSLVDWSLLAREPLVVTYDRMDREATFNINGIDAVVALDRAGCNRLIRALRKARDDVFGRDE